ncbi:unnamed protein product [Darwinula stevensoni]|uniref:ATP synthase subunit gamma n=1 Tax=Darwinula stevensoni TaxID=69355 RepID=A0A7R9A789_9CRUS|nr:unnamed protein product [Darwinula stevensoni]CAG0892172.1 unnamed protein product [Darwinula stevensoni]
MPTLKDISVRLKSVKNIQKITQSMKMVSAAKYARAERELKQARPYGEGVKAFYDRAEVKPPVEQGKRLLVAMSSDRGLCGAIHSNIGKAIKSEMAHSADNTMIVCIGDKARTILQKLYQKQILYVASEVGRKPPVFGDAAKLAQAILSSGYDFSSGTIYYNWFKSVVSYRTSQLPLFSMEQVMQSEKYPIYDSLDNEVMQSYMEYSLTSLLFYAMKEGACSEQSSRMTAMDSATKNAGEMIDKLTLTFNRTRQAVITKELIEIISGAAAI